MSIASKRRFVTKQIESEFVLPKENDIIAQIIATRGNNLHEVEDANGEKYLASMPTKFRKSIWVKRGQFVLVQPIEEGDKVKAEITCVLDDQNVLYIRDEKLWPQRFEKEAERLTRESKRHIVGENKPKHKVIDDDMLPPSDSDGDADNVDDDDDKNEVASSGKEEEINSEGEMKSSGEQEEEEEEEEEEDGDDDDDNDESSSDEDEDRRPIIDTYNPNRCVNPEHH